jgi:hypothetical protein
LLAASPGPLGHFPDWARRLDQATDNLERQLFGLQREPNTAHMSAALSDLRPLVREATTAGAELRAAMRQTGGPLAATDRSTLTGGILDEIRAVSAGIAYLHSQTAVPVLPAPGVPRAPTEAAAAPK